MQSSYQYATGRLCRAAMTVSLLFVGNSLSRVLLDLLSLNPLPPPPPVVLIRAY